ncbi:MAG TPA: antibiotic biosynthesis monooxygenase [Thermoanaerobaculia bacterium]|nr:antibiotic biosynthesis monooxygenase [Thermoanaerobaculia bacterium]
MRRITTSLLYVCLFAVCGAALAATEYRFERSIGKPPAIGEPINLTVDASGTIYVADRTNGQVIRVTPDGKMTTNAVRTGLRRPTALAIGPNGSLLVADESEGGSVVTFATPRTTTTKPKTFRVAPGATAARAMGGPGGIAADRAGNVYITDQFQSVVNKYSASGELLTTWGKRGSAPGEFQGPRGVATDARGNVYVADEYNNRIQKFDSSGKLLGQSTAETLGFTIANGMGPMSVAVDSKGNIWVAAHTNFAVYKLTPDFRMEVRLDTFGRRFGELAGPVSVAVDSKDNVLILDRSRRIQKFSPNGTVLWKFEFPEAKAGELSAPTGVNADAQGSLWVADTANFRIQKFGADGQPLLTFGRFGNGDGEFNGVESIGIDVEGNLWAVDSYNHRVQKFTPDGKFLLKVGSFGRLPKEFIRTKVIGPDPINPVIYVNDWHNARVQKFDLNGTFITSFGDTGPDSTRVYGPTGIVAGRDGYVYVSSWFNNAIQKFDSSGKHVATIGGPGTGNGQFKGPARLTTDGAGNLVVADWGNSRVQILDGNGKFVAKFGGPGRADGSFDQPVGVSVDARGNLFVSDAGNSRVQKFAPVGNVGAARAKPAAKPVARKSSGEIYTHVALYDVKAGQAEAFEAALRAIRGSLEREPSLINDRVLRNVDGLTLQYATYAKFSDRAAAERAGKARIDAVRAWCRRDPESHLALQTDAYSLTGASAKPSGREYGDGMTGQIAHLGLFIPIPQYRKQYDDILRDTKNLTLARKPEGYIGEDLLVELAAAAPAEQTPYSPHALEPSPMSINYGEYKTMENAEDSYITRQVARDQKLVTMERTFFSSLQVPTRFYIFQVIDNYGRTAATSKIAAANGGR